jgi:hypothetical protein
MEEYMKSFHIAAYVFKADIMCCDCVSNWAEDELKEERNYNEDDIRDIIANGPGYDMGVYAYRSEGLLSKLAEIREIDLEDQYSWDSDDFPKVVFADQVEEKEYCGNCHEVIP